MSELISTLLIFIVAILYSAVGHGGASGYIAALSLMGIDSGIIKTTALLLNVFVSILAFVQFKRSGYFRWNLFLYFIIGSVPMAYLGSGIHIDAILYKRMLGVCLLFPILKLTGVLDNFENKEKSTFSTLEIGFCIIIGGLIGFLSGLLGIGGGIILSPIILILGWANMKQTAAVSSLFIFVNSLAGLINVFQKNIEINDQMLSWIAAASIGGIVGSYFGSKLLNVKLLKYTLALVLFVAFLKLIFI
ncbi:MAG: sulfite exporter TauE/SafE family protein [Bacteroidota bacterium]|nr:sulfite exporter TauE/SafE family protein [Bacteroidota bacterium]